MNCEDYSMAKRKSTKSLGKRKEIIYKHEAECSKHVQKLAKNSEVQKKSPGCNNYNIEKLNLDKQSLRTPQEPSLAYITQ